MADEVNQNQNNTAGSPAQPGNTKPLISADEIQKAVDAAKGREPVGDWPLTIGQKKQEAPQEEAIAPLPEITPRPETPARAQNAEVPTEHITVIPEDIKEVAKQEKDFLPPLRGAVSPMGDERETEKKEAGEKSPDEKPKIQPIIRTFKGDIAGAVRDQSMSLAGIAIKEDEKRREEAGVAAHAFRVNTLLVTLSLIFIVAGGGLIGYLKFFHKTDGPSTTVKVPQVKSIVFADEHEDIDLTDKTFRETREEIFKQILGKRLTVGNIKSLTFINTRQVETADGTKSERYYIPGSEFFDRVGISAPESFLRQLDPNFMYGMYSFKGQTAFLILKTSDYASLFAELLAYENRMARDLYPILSGTSSPDTADRLWTDEVIQNIDTRTLRDPFGDLVMLWSFLGTRDKVLITINEDVFKEIVDRLQTPTRAQ